MPAGRSQSNAIHNHLDFLRARYRWLPIMKAYESGSAAYFATPPVNLIYAFHASLSKITKSSPSLAERYELHREASRRIKTAATELGLKQLPLDPAFSANGMTAVRIFFFFLVRTFH